VYRSAITWNEARPYRQRCPRCGERLVAVAGRQACIVAACRLKAVTSPTTKEHQP
jgi:transcription initiation factor IIE alpha subunit